MTTAALRKTALTGAEKFWYVLGNIALGAAYFSKVPVKKAMSDFGLTTLTAAEAFWYVLMCIAFGAGYFAKLPTAKALSELPQIAGAATYRELAGQPQQAPEGQARIAGPAPGLTPPAIAPEREPGRPGEPAT